MDNEFINCQGDTLIYIDGVKISGVLVDYVPIPDMRSNRATLMYNSILGDEGQKIIDMAAHSGGEIHEYRVEIGGLYKWVYDGKITHYKALHDGWLIADVEIKLCGKFSYIRGEDILNRTIISEECE